MKRLIYIGLAALGLFYGTHLSAQNLNSSSIPESKKITYSETESEKAYLDTIVYQNFSEINFNSLDNQKRCPRIIEKYLENDFYRPKIKDAERFKELVLHEAEKLGFSSEKIKSLSALETITLSVDIVKKRMSYFEVDDDPTFIMVYGAHLPHDFYFELGKGDCDKYSNILIATFEVIKSVSKNLVNIVIMEEELGFIGQLHSWDQLCIFFKDRIVISQIDPTFYDNGGKLEAKTEWHIPDNKDLVIATFLSKIWAFEKSYDKYKDCLNQEKNHKEKILRNMAYLSFQLKDKGKMDFVRDIYCGNGYLKNLDNILYYSYRIEKSIGNEAEAEKYKMELIGEFPNSFWISMVSIYQNFEDTLNQARGKK